MRQIHDLRAGGRNLVLNYTCVKESPQGQIAKQTAEILTVPSRLWHAVCQAASAKDCRNCLPRWQSRPFRIRRSPTRMRMTVSLDVTATHLGPAAGGLNEIWATASSSVPTETVCSANEVSTLRSYKESCPPSEATCKSHAHHIPTAASLQDSPAMDYCAPQRWMACMGRWKAM